MERNRISPVRGHQRTNFIVTRNALLLWAFLIACCLHCSEASSQILHNDEAVRHYISISWNTLTRSTSDCKSYEDTKVADRPVLFIPHDFQIDSDFRSFVSRCQIDIERLPRIIEKLDDVPVSSLRRNGLLYLPRPYVVPGGRFNEMYGWDSYFIELGLLVDNRKDLAQDIVENFLFEVEHYGGVLNANRSYYLSRSQPPFLATMILSLYRSHGTRQQSESGLNKVWLGHAYNDAERVYSFWIGPDHQAGDTGLSRYFDLEGGPVPEMADDDQYYAKVEQWLKEHPLEHPEYLINEPDAAHRSKLSEEFFRGDRADRESGFDTTFRFGPFSGSTHHFAPVCLNSLLYRYERDMEKMALLLGKTKEARAWSLRAQRRRLLMNRYLWDAKVGGFVDYDFVRKQRSNYPYATFFYPLWAGLATPGQAKKMTALLPQLEVDHGVQMSTFASGLQWDSPFGWAPCNWIVVDGLRSYGFERDARRIAAKFTRMVEENFEKEGTIREKYNVKEGTTEVQVSNGYKQNVTGFGWTNGVYLVMQQFLQK